MSSNQVSGPVKRSFSGDAAAPQRKAHQTVKGENDVA